MSWIPSNVPAHTHTHTHTAALKPQLYSLTPGNRSTSTPGHTCLYTWKDTHTHTHTHRHTHTLTACSYGEVQINIDVDQWWRCQIKGHKVLSMVYWQFCLPQPPSPITSCPADTWPPIGWNSHSQAPWPIDCEQTSEGRGGVGGG